MNQVCLRRFVALARTVVTPLTACPVNQTSKVESHKARSFTYSLPEGMPVER